MTYAEDKARGRAAALAGEPFDHRETIGWEHGYGDAVVIEPVDAPEETGQGAAMTIEPQA